MALTQTVLQTTAFFYKTIPSELWSCQPFARREDAQFRTLVNPYGKGIMETWINHACRTNICLFQLFIRWPRFGRLEFKIRTPQAIETIEEYHTFR